MANLSFALVGEHGHRSPARLFFSQSLDGFFFMMLDEPIRWDERADKEQLLDYVFTHQRITKVNDAMLAQYGATREQFLGLTPRTSTSTISRSAVASGASSSIAVSGIVKTHERRFDGTPIDIEGDYICLTMRERRIIGHFGIQRDVTEAVRLQAEVARHAAELETQCRRAHRGARSEARRIRAIVNALPDVVFVLDGEGRTVEIVTDDARRLLPQRPRAARQRVHDVLPCGRLRSARLRGRRSRRGTVQVLEYPLEPRRNRWFEAASAATAYAAVLTTCPCRRDRPRHHRPQARRTNSRSERLPERGVRHRPPLRRNPRPIGGDAGGLQGD